MDQSTLDIAIVSPEFACLQLHMAYNLSSLTAMRYWTKGFEADGTETMCAFFWCAKLRRSLIKFIEWYTSIWELANQSSLLPFALTLLLSVMLMTGPCSKQDSKTYWNLCFMTEGEQWTISCNLHHSRIFSKPVKLMSQFQPYHHTAPVRKYIPSHCPKL